MIFYAWTAMNGGNPETPESSVAMGITDDRAKAMRAGEESLGSGQATVVIIEAVRPAMTAPTLAPCYAQTGVAWLGRRTGAGEVAWARLFWPGTGWCWRCASRTCGCPGIPIAGGSAGTG